MTLIVQANWLAAFHSCSLFGHFPVNLTEELASVFLAIGFHVLTTADT